MIVFGHCISYVEHFLLLDPISAVLCTVILAFYE
jgi:hypothetical protein